MSDVEVLDDAAAATAVLDPMRARILAELAEPGSASTVAQAIGETRQKVNYHLRTLEAAGLVELVEERPRRGLTERVVRASAQSYVVSPAALGRLAPEVESRAGTPPPDQLSSRYLIAVAARLVREVGHLARSARQAGRPAATLTIDTEIRFADAEARAAFAADLAEAVTTLAARYHDEQAPRGRRHRLIVASHPRPIEPDHTPPRSTP